MAFKRIGFGQVEPNQLSAQKTGQIYASLPLAEDVEILQNGEFMYYDYKSGTVTADSIGEPMLVFNEIKLYDDRFRLKDFAMIRTGKDSYVTNPTAIGSFYPMNYGWAEGQETYGNGSSNVKVDPSPAHSSYQDGYSLNGIAPRVFKTNIGDIMTTNMVVTGDSVTYEKGDILEPKKVSNKSLTSDSKTYNTLVLTKTGTDVPATGMAWVVAKVYTMPDGQQGLKLQRVQ